MKAVSLEYNLEIFMGVQRTGDEEFFKQVTCSSSSSPSVTCWPPR